MDSSSSTSAVANSRQKAFETVQRIKRKLSQDVVETHRAQKKYIAEGMAKELLILNISDENNGSPKWKQQSSVTSNPFLTDSPASPVFNRLRRRTSRTEESKKENDANANNDDGVLNFTLPQEVVDYLSRPSFQSLLPSLSPDNSKALILYTPPQPVVPAISSPTALEERKTMDVEEEESNGASMPDLEEVEEEEAEVMYF